MKSSDELTATFRSRGLKMTPQRHSIFRALNAMHGTHPTAEAVYETVVAEMPTVSLKTVYQTLNDLADMGEVIPLDVGAGPRRYDTTLEPHQHATCDLCGEVWDVHFDVSRTFRPPHIDDHVSGFSISSVDVVYRGQCAKCAASHAHSRS